MTNDEPVEADHLEQATRELLDAVRQDDIARIKVLVKSGADVNGAAPRTGYTPLMWAKSAEATRTLIRAGASVRARDQQGHTPLMWVISKNNVPDQAALIAKGLIDAGADVNDQDNEGQTPLHWARHHRDRLREPRLRHIAEQLVSILESATTDPLRRLEAAGFTREQARAIGDYVGALLAKANLAETATEDETDRDSSLTDVLEPVPRKRGALQHQVSRLMHVLLDRRWGLVDEAELERWRDADYCQHRLGLKISHLGLLRKANEGPLDRKGRGRYWTEAYHERWLVCSQWWKMDHAWNAMALTRLCKRIVGSTGDRVPTEVFGKPRTIERDLARLAER